MQVNFNPAASTNPNFKAINQSWLNKIKRNTSFADNDLYASLLAGSISRTDAVDTLVAAKEHYSPNFKDFFDRTIKHFKEVKL